MSSLVAGLVLNLVTVTGCFKEVQRGRTGRWGRRVSVGDKTDNKGI